MLVWRTSLGQSHRYRMFSVVVSWTNNKDPTSDKGIWLHGTEWEAQCSTRGCPSREEPFSTLGTDIKAVSTLLKSSHIHTHKDIHAHKHTCVPVYTHTRCRKYACHGHTGKGGSKNNFLSTGIRKTTVERGSAWRERECGTKAFAPSELIILQREDMKGRCNHMNAVTVLPNTRQGKGQAGGERTARRGKPSLKTFHINRDIGRLLKFKYVWDTGIHNSLQIR